MPIAIPPTPFNIAPALPAWALIFPLAPEPSAGVAGFVRASLNCFLPSANLPLGTIIDTIAA